MVSHTTRCLTTLLIVLAGPSSLAGQARYDLLVSSRGTSSVKRYDGETGAYLGDFIAPGAGGLSLTQEVRIGPDRSIYVTGRGNGSVLRFDRRTGSFLGPATNGYPLDQPTKLTIANDRIYVSQWGQVRSSVATFDATTGAFLGEATPNLRQPMQHLVEPGGLLVADFEARSVLRFDRDGNPMGPAITGRSLQGPVNLWRHSSGDLLVMDWTAGSVERFDGASGSFRNTFISGLTTAEGWAIGPDGRLYIADWSRNLILRYDAETGALVGVFASGGGLSQPNSLVFVERTPEFRMSVAPTAALVAAGQKAVAAIVIEADRGLAFPGPVKLSCGGLPAGWACEVARDAMPGATADTVELAVRTSARLAFASPFVAVGVAGFGWLVLLSASNRRRRLRAVATTALMAGCGGVPPTGSSESSSAEVTVIARGDGLERMATFVVTVAR